MKVVFLTNTPAPYRIPFYAEWTKLDELVVVFDQAAAVGRDWVVDPNGAGFNFQILKSRRLTLSESRKDLHFKERKTIYFSFNVFPLLKREKPDLIISIEFGFRSLVALAYASWFGVPLVLVNEGTPHTERNVGWLKTLVRKFLVQRAKGFWSNGRDSTELLMSYGASPSQIQAGMTGVDTSLFQSRVSASMGSRNEIREHLGVQGITFLILGSVSGRKGIPQLRDAIDHLLSLSQLSFTLILLGDGDEMEATKIWANRLPPQVKVIFPGFVQIDRVPEFMVAADWGMMPTVEDCWPLATLEMLVAGLPQLFSIYNGGTAELCREGVTGHAFDPCNTLDFGGRIADVIARPSRKLERSVIEEFANFYSPKAQAERASQSSQRFLEASRC